MEFKYTVEDANSVFESTTNFECQDCGNVFKTSPQRPKCKNCGSMNISEMKPSAKYKGTSAEVPGIGKTTVN